MVSGHFKDRVQDFSGGELISEWAGANYGEISMNRSIPCERGGGQRVRYWTEIKVVKHEISRGVSPYITQAWRNGQSFENKDDTSLSNDIKIF